MLTQELNKQSGFKNRVLRNKNHKTKTQQKKHVDHKPCTQRHALCTPLITEVCNIQFPKWVILCVHTPDFVCDLKENLMRKQSPSLYHPFGEGGSGGREAWGLNVITL